MFKITYLKDLIVESSITQITHKHINQHSTDVFNSYKINKTHNVKKTCYNFTNGVVINKHITINANGTYTISKTHNLLNTTDNNYYTKKKFNTSGITNFITRHSHTNYEHNVVQKFNRHIKHTTAILK